MKKNVVLIFIVFVIVFVLGIITNYIDSGRVTTGYEPIFCIKTISKDGSRVTYIGLGYKVVRYVGVSPNEPFNSNIGVKMGSWFMKYDLPSDNVIIVETEDGKFNITDYKDVQFIGNILENSKYDKDICKCMGIYTLIYNNQEYYVKESREIQKGINQAEISEEDYNSLLEIIENYKNEDR